MECPKCNAEGFERNEYCQECGYDLLDDSTNEPESDFFEEIMSFYKSAFLSPWKSIGRPIHMSTVIIAVGLLLSTLSLISVLRLMTAFDGSPPPGSTPLMPLVITFIVFLIILAVVFLIYYGLTYLMNVIVIKDREHWKQVFSDFSLLAVILNTLYILFALSVEILPSAIGLLSILIGFVLSISVPVFVVSKYAMNNNSRINIVLPIIIYYGIVLTVNLAFFGHFLTPCSIIYFIASYFFEGGQRVCICHYSTFAPR